jgi:hypothetical protein
MGYNSLLQGNGAIRCARPAAGISPTRSHDGFLSCEGLPIVLRFSAISYRDARSEVSRHLVISLRLYMILDAMEPAQLNGKVPSAVKHLRPVKPGAWQRCESSSNNQRNADLDLLSLAQCTDTYD